MEKINCKWLTHGLLNKGEMQTLKLGPEGQNQHTAGSHSCTHIFPPTTLPAADYTNTIVLSQSSQRNGVTAAFQQAATLPHAMRLRQTETTTAAAAAAFTGFVRGAHLFLREDLELPAEPRLPRRTKGQSSYSSGDQLSLGRSRLKLGWACRSTDMPAMHHHTHQPFSCTFPLRTQ